MKFKLKWPRPENGELDTSNLVDKMLSPVAFWQLFFLIAVTVLVSMWNLDGVRLYVFDHLERGRQARAIRALSDPSDEVAASACYSILERNDSALYLDIENTLYRRPPVALLCLDRAAENLQKDRAQDAQQSPDTPIESLQMTPNEDIVPNYVLIASSLGRRWMSDLINGSDNTCLTALNTRHALDLARVDPTYRLMSCAVGADSPEVRECCVTQLGGHAKFLALLDQPELAPLFPASFDYRALVGSAFPSVPLASDLLGRRHQYWMAEVPVAQAATPETGGGERFGDLQADVQDWVVNVGCRIHYSLLTRQQVPAAFVPLVESQGCAPTSPPWTGMYNANSWADMCQGIYQYRRDLAYTPREAICGALAASTASQSITMARIVVASALNRGLQVPGVRHKKIKFTGHHFGGRLLSIQNQEKKINRPPPWKINETTSPMGSW